MKNVKNVKNPSFWQIDHQIKNIFQYQGIIILPSLQAWEKFRWSQRLFKKKPKEGYFVWVKKQINFPLTTCVTIASPKTKQSLDNLLVIEKNIKVKANAVCNAAKNDLLGTHQAQGRIVLKPGAFLEYNHLHQWGEKDFVNTDYEFILQENSHLVYIYKNLLPPKNLSIKAKIQSDKNSSSDTEIIIEAKNSQVQVQDEVFLNKDNAQGTVRLKLAGRKNSKIKAISRIIASGASKGHLDCQGLLVDKQAQISLTPELVCKNKEAQLTHEASIGKIAQEQLTYLQMRGLTEKQAINLIVNGFLKK